MSTPTAAEATTGATTAPPARLKPIIKAFNRLMSQHAFTANVLPTTPASLPSLTS